MDNRYKLLGFDRQVVLENPIGIKIYVGTKGLNDWSIEIPNELVKMKLTRSGLNSKYINEYYSKQDYYMYLVSEEEVLRIAEEYMRLKRGN